MSADVDVVGADFLTEVRRPCVLWVVDGTAATVRRGLRAAGWRDRLHIVSPVVGVLPIRRGPSVALLADDPVLTADHLSQLLPVPVVPVWIGGAFTAGPLRVRIGTPLNIAADESVGRFTDRVADAADAVAAEERLGWWQVSRSHVDSATVFASADPVVTPGGWRQRWMRTNPASTAAGIWRR